LHHLQNWPPSFTRALTERYRMLPGAAADKLALDRHEQDHNRYDADDRRPGQVPVQPDRARQRLIAGAQSSF
jgi:hypothetical protein